MRHNPCRDIKIQLQHHERSSTIRRKYIQQENKQEKTKIKKKM